MEPQSIAITDGEGKTYDTHMEYVIQNNPTLKAEYDDLLSRHADVIATAGKGTEPVKNKDQSRVPSTTPVRASQEPVQTFSGATSILPSDKFHPANLGTEEPSAPGQQTQVEEYQKGQFRERVQAAMQERQEKGEKFQKDHPNISSLLDHVLTASILLGPGGKGLLVVKSPPVVPRVPDIVRVPRSKTPTISPTNPYHGIMDKPDKPIPK